MIYLKKTHKICLGSANFCLNYGLKRKKPITIKNIKKIFNYPNKKILKLL